VSSKLKYGAVFVLLGIWLLLMIEGAPAITAELARKCQALTDKAFPLLVPGNPAAGRTHGTARDLLDYYNNCVSNRGNVSNPPAAPEGTPASPAGVPGPGGH
jgi:hypothetical protein